MGSTSTNVGLPAGVDTDWWQHVQREIATGEYHASVGVAGLQAPNRAQSFRTYFRNDGIEIIPRDPGPMAWRWGWQTTAWGRGNRWEPVGATTPEHVAARVEYARERFVEWYRNGTEGVEQGFTLDTTPPGDGALWIEGTITGSLRAVASSDDIQFIDDSGAAVLLYSHLLVNDADGRELDARLTLADDVIRIEVNDGGAVYPITIDPLMSTPDWIGAIEAEDSAYSQTVATAGDVNGDGYSDVVVGAPLYTADQSEEGRVYCYLGSADGPSTSPHWWTDGNQPHCRYGSSISAAGDVNGDGYDDVAVGSDLYDGPETDEGRVYVYFGSPNGPEREPGWIMESDQAGAEFGHAVSTAGDVNGDRYDDLIVGAPGYSHGESREGMAWIYQGSASGPVSTPRWTGECDQSGANYGCAVATAGDVNGDGYADVVVGADAYDAGQRAEGSAFVYHGSASGTSSSPAWAVQSDREMARLGWSVAGAGDVNGDGYADVIVGAPWYDGGPFVEGRAYLYPGSAAGLESSPSWMLDGAQVDGGYGFSVATAGDVNGDGYSDVMVSAHEFTGEQDDEGRVYLYLGDWTGLSSTPAWWTDGNEESAVYGYQVGTAGDVNGDGFSDVIVGSPGYDPDGDGNAEGQAFVFHGSAAGPQVQPGWVTESNQDWAQYGNSVAHVGDVNGDGYGDVLVGTAMYDNGEQNEGAVFLFLGSHLGLSFVPVWYAEGNQVGALLGKSVAWAGDVNGDGYPDAIVGARGYDWDHSGAGAAFIWFSRPGGAPYGTPDNADWRAFGGQEEELFGYSVASAGDVNGDGYADVVVGAPYYDGGEIDEGAAYVYLGSETGPSPTHDWMFESNNAESRCGWSVASAGDFNGDGFSDVIVSAPLYTDPLQWEGAVFVHLGSEDGLHSAGPWWWAQGDQDRAEFGHSVAAGDVNGDGFSDVLVGAIGYDDTALNGGAGFVWHGAEDPPPLGIPANADWSFTHGDSSTRLGSSVAMGDVDSDGFSDVLVGGLSTDTWEGLAALWFGSAEGVMGGEAAWQVEGSESSHFGYSVAAAGDVNGDGFCDVLVGAPFHDAGESNEGRVFLYYGNDSRGMARIPRQHEANFSTPIALLGHSDTETAFGLRALGRTAAGRGRVRMEVEVKPFRVPFDGTDTRLTGWIDTGTPDGAGGSRVVIEQAMSGLVEGLAYRWRVRFVSGNPFFPRSPWFSLPGNGAGEMDVQTAGVLVSVAPPTPAACRPRLGAVTPNPFNPRTTISYVLNEDAPVRLTLHDVNGRLVRILVEKAQGAGEYSAVWDGRNDGGQPLASGVYFIRLQSGGDTATRQVVLMK